MQAAPVILLCWAMAGAACFFSPGGVLVPVALATLVAVIGLPHGAADHRFAKPLLEPRWGAAWLPAFLVGYLAIALAVVVGWVVTPVITVVLFFLVSAWHFGQEEPRLPIGPRWFRSLGRFARGGLVIWTPLIVHQPQVADLLATTAPRAFESQILLSVTLMAVAAWGLLVAAVAAWGLQSLTALASEGRRRRVLLIDALLQASLFVLFVVASPVVGFLVYFCAWHSARGLRRLRRELNESWRQLALSLAPMTLGAVGLVAFGSFGLARGVTLDETLVRSTFVGLSAVAVPHIVLHGLLPVLRDVRTRRGVDSIALGRPA
ncbi:MAG: Brp/Blh family beta-carotene 15,15'-dioxygenase [Planctomycetota bacterium]